MADSDPTDRDRSATRSPSTEDEIAQAGVLAFVFDQHPTHLTTAELTLAMSHGREDFAAEDEIERAIRELVGAGLLRLACRLVMPTRAALYFDSLGVD